MKTGAKTFSGFKTEFYSRIDGLEIFNCEEFNLIKVVLDGLKVKYSLRGRYRAYLFYPLFFYKLFLKFKCFRSRKRFDVYGFLNKISGLAEKKICISDIGRIVKVNNREVKSIYFDNLIQILGREKIIIALDKIKNPDLDFDVEIELLKQNAHFIPDNNELYKLRGSLLESYREIAQTKKFNKGELENIRIAIHKFYIDFKVWSFLLNNLRGLEKCYFVCHYHKEGQILALKRRGIECIELQHGLIAEQDIFYVFPEVVKNYRHKCLFADKMLVYGDYWKNVLLRGNEYLESQIKIIGYYLFDDFDSNLNDKSEIEGLISGKKVILITTQTFLHEHFIEFTLSLYNRMKSEQQDVLFLVKPHPAENERVYKDAFLNIPEIKVVNFPLSLLFEKIKTHISVYSTTLYDGVRFDVSNFVFKVSGCEDYVDEIIKSGIAEEIHENTNFFEKKNYLNLSPYYYYSKFKPSEID